jgi:hypothetical protein
VFATSPTLVTPALGTPSSGTLTNCTFPTLNQNTTGTAAVSTAATVTTSATASAFKVPFANTTASTTGNYGLLQDSEATFTYNPSTNTLVVGTVSAALSGNATTATTLQTARTIGGVSFNGSANINLPGVNTAGNQNTTGSAASLTTARAINGTDFNGTAAITTANWGTARTIWGQSINGSANITAPLLPAAGSVTAPAFSTSGDTNTGIFFPAADQVAVATNGVERVNLGNSATVFNDGGADVDFRVEGDTDANLLFVDASADAVGVGTNTPAVSGLEISKATGSATPTPVELRLSTTNDGSDWSTTDPWGRLSFYSADTSSAGPKIVSAIDVTAVAASGGTGNLSFKLAAITTGTLTERMRITSDGNVGIGTSSPAVRLDVSSTGNGYRFLASDTTNDNTLGTYSDSTNIRHVSVNNARSTYKQYGIQANGIIFSATNGNESARITSGGFFKASNDGAYVGSTGSFHELRTTTQDANVVYITNANATSPYGTLIYFTGATPNNTTNTFLSCEDSTNAKCLIYSSGTISNRTGTYNAISDIKLKQDIVDASSQWDDIKALRIVKYRLKDEVAADPNYPAYIGLVAQEVEQVSAGLVDDCPDFETVTRTREVEKTREVEVTPAVLDEDGNVVEPAVMETETYTEEEEYTERVATGTVTKSVKSSILYMKAVKALQEAMERIETLEANNAALEARITAIENGA